MILSYVALSDVRSVSQVCKLWYKCFKKAAFWTRHVKMYLRPLLCKELPANDVEHVLSLFHPFMWKMCSMENRLGWLYKRNNPVNLEFSDSTVKMNIYLYAVGLEAQFKKLDGQWYLFRLCFGSYKRLDTKSVLDGNSHVYVFYKPGEHPYFCGPVHLQYRCKNDQKLQSRIKCKTVEGHIFEGQCSLHNQLPHGKGKWTFADGTTLTGDRVAYDGAPHGVGRDDEAEWFAGERLEKKRQKI